MMSISKSNTLELLKDILAKQNEGNCSTAEFQQIARIVEHLQTEPLDDTSLQMLTEIESYCTYALNPATKNSADNPYAHSLNTWITKIDTLY